MAEFHHVCDVLVVGAGPAGMAAAYRAAKNGLRVVVVDDNPAAGGQIWRGEAKTREAREWFERIRSVEIQFVHGARVFQQTATGSLLAETSRDVCELTYKSLILATGARERFLPFPGWTLPNPAPRRSLSAASPSPDRTGAANAGASSPACSCSSCPGPGAQDSCCRGCPGTPRSWSDQHRLGSSPVLRRSCT